MQDRSILLVIESYVLATIGALEPERHAHAGVMVQRLLGGAPGTNWMATVRAKLGWGPDFDATIHENWERIKKIGAKEAEFAREFADEVGKMIGLE